MAKKDKKTQDINKETIKKMKENNSKLKNMNKELFKKLK